MLHLEPAPPFFWVLIAYSHVQDASFQHLSQLNHILTMHFITNLIPDVYFHKQEIGACQLLLVMFSRQLALFGKVSHHAECLSHISFQHSCDQRPFRGSRTGIQALLSCFVKLIRLVWCAFAAASVIFYPFLKGLLFLSAAIRLSIMFCLAHSPCGSLAPEQTDFSLSSVSKTMQISLVLQLGSLPFSCTRK